MPGMDGLEVQEEMTLQGYNLPVIVLTGHGDITTAVRAMKGGAIDFLEKPFNRERLVKALDASPEWRRLASDDIGVIHIRTAPKAR